MARGRTTGCTLRSWARASNRSAIGARVRCVAGGVLQVHEVRGGGSYISQNDLRVHFGLGTRDAVERVDVRWPSGLEEQWRDVGADQIADADGGHGRRQAPAKRIAVRAAGCGAVGGAGCVAIACSHRGGRVAGPRQRRPPRPLAQARALIDQGQPKDAIETLPALDAPTRAWPHVLGVAYYHADDHPQAIELLAPVVAAPRGLDRAPRGRAGARPVATTCGPHGRGDAVAGGDARVGDGQHRAAQVLGNAYIQTRQPDKAREALARAFGVAPGLGRPPTCSPPR